MTHEYGDPVYPEVVSRAVDLTLERMQRHPQGDLDQHVAEAVQQAFCACVRDIEDQVEGRLSGVHAALIAEVKERVLQRRSASEAAGEDAVDEASRESFPASDPPSWIFHHPTD